MFLGGGDGLSVLELEGGTLDLSSDANLLTNGVMRGDGQVSLEGALMIHPGAEVRAREGDYLLVQAGLVENEGSIEAVGRAAAPAEIEFSGQVTNFAETGFITGHEATLRFGQGLTNHGSLAFVGGFNELRGDLTNEAEGSVVVTAGATAVFYDDVFNSSTITVSASGPVESVAVFLGELTGNGILGTGHVFAEGDLRPGFSPGTMSFGGDLTCTPSTVFHLEIGGPTAGSEYDQLVVNGRLHLDGVLNISFTDGYTPAADDQLVLWHAGEVTGEFRSVTLPQPPAGLFWHDDLLNTTGTLTIADTPEDYHGFALVSWLPRPSLPISHSSWSAPLI